MSNKAFFTIGETCKLIGVNPQTLRRWEREGKITCVMTQGGQRRFPAIEIAKILNINVEDLNTQILSKREEDSLDQGLKEVKKLHLAIEKERASKTLSNLKGGEVQQARDEYKILKLTKMKEKLMEDERRAEAKRKKRERRQEWLEGHILFAYKCLDIPKKLKRSLACFANYKEEKIPIELKVQVRKRILELLGDVSEGEDVNAIRLLISRAVDEVRNEYFQPVWKNEAMTNILSWLQNTQWPLWMDKKIIELAITHIRKNLEEKLTGFEQIEDTFDMAESMKDSIINTLMEEKRKNEHELMSDFIKDIKNV